MTIFLTGSTGFLGGKLLNNLLQSTDHTLYVLVRNFERAERTIRKLPDGSAERIRLFKGDITQENCGLSQADIEEIKGNVDIVYHLAALVKFDEALRDELFSINYDGTRQVLELAKQLGVSKFYYISTAYTIGKHDYGVEKLYPIEAKGHNPYEESKVKSEHLAFSYANDFDVSIFRPSIIVGDSNTGEADSEFTLYGFMRALDVFKRRIARASESTNTVYHVIGSKDATSNFVPVNYVADILAIAESKAEPNTIYHITNPKPATNYDILTLIKNALDFNQLEIIEDTKNTILRPEEERLNEMIDVFNVYLSRSFDFDDTNTQKLIQDTQISHLNMSHDTLKMIINAYFDLND
ncbi:SDR family oxidoreductase [Sporosarcina pasteurii]|uniref:Linear gramicidin synthase subunit D n=1 Tax=Sporosarcina pasteurii TaxID=1474 RepID=A0A380CDB9_SPOPA|nr:SDR family oxidoreductase [Sporosarcina pasteurii]MDS9473088.1 SDR family oxidoreductase [Sporosarcina pasteurii]QBQ04261.1 NAD-dependent epimerase/dehydratase family protein [Sporosarcina pasteurii]SUJ17006.1 Linear gramicidin synthase subunit D [Sporosarcina pasteurii]